MDINKKGKKLLRVIWFLGITNAFCYAETSIMTNENNYQFFLLGYFMLMLITIFKGVGENRTVIVFQDYNDIGLTLLVPVSAYLIFWIFVFFGGSPQFAIYLAWAVALILFVKLARNTYEANHKQLLHTVLALMTKLPLGILWFFNLITALNPGGKTSTKRRKNRGSALVLLTLLTPIISLLVVNKEGSLFNPKEWITGRGSGNIRNLL